MDHPDKIEPRVGEPINDLCWSLNHYISLADHLGVCFGRDTSTEITVWIMVNQEMELDQEDFEKLRARLQELEEEGFEFSLEHEEDRGKFVVYSLHVPNSEVEDLTDALREEPGPKGWGSPRKILVQEGLLQEDGSIDLDVLR